MDEPADERPPTRGAKPAPRSRPRVDKEARKAEYLRAAARAFLAHGASASMQDIADAAGAPKPVFYRIFPSRAELIEALFGHVHDTILRAQQGAWDGYGWALRVVYLEAKKDPEIFLVVLRTFRGDPALQRQRDRLYGLIQKRAAAFFTPAADAPPGPPDRIARASATMTGFLFDSLVAWLEDADGLTDDRRFTWFAHIVREWRLATREAYELDAPAKKNEGKA